MEPLEKLLNNQVVSEKAKNFIYSLKYWQAGIVLVAPEPDIVVFVNERQVYGRGVGYISQVIVYCEGNSQTLEYKWRDPDEPALDRFDLGVRGIKGVRVERCAGPLIKIFIHLDNDIDLVEIARFTK